MPNADENPLERTVSVTRLREWTAADIAEKEDPRFCDTCSRAVVLGCAVAVHLGYDYKELCESCARLLLGELTKAMEGRGL